ncbi:MAG: hypothetical protein MPN21_03640 [Thermoanaerobaculia bacterium]|nr:hypothetical protein [Thermoanaerobaculia bacterium]
MTSPTSLSLRNSYSRNTSHTTRTVLLVLTVLCTVFGAVACSGGQGSQDDASATDKESAPSTPSADTGGADSFEPVTSRSEGEEEGSLPTDIAPAGGTSIQAPGVSFHLPAEWRNETPSSSMRMAQASIPGESGDGQLTVFYFGPGGGGGVDANIDRWVGQVELDPGSLPRRIRMDLEGGLVAHWIEVTGTLRASVMGTGPTEPQPGSRLQGAVVEGPQGPWFFKATGPSATLDAQRDAFFSMLHSLKPSA